MTFERVDIGDAVTLYHGDCREILPLLPAVDAVITDPVWPNAPEGLFAVDNPESLLSEALQCVTARRIVIVLRYDSDPRFLRAVPERYPFFRVQVLRYAVPERNGRKLGGMELAYSFGEPVSSAPGKRLIPGWSPAATRSAKGESEHPCNRSLFHTQWLVNWWSSEGDVIVDPFMGGGTTVEAALNLGRRVIGIEIKREYFDMTVSRIRDAQARLPLFRPTPFGADAAISRHVEQLELSAAPLKHVR